MNRVQMRDERKERFAEWFKDHRATLEVVPMAFESKLGKIDRLIWSRPRDFNYGVLYVSSPSTLVVTGDLEVAVYRVSGPGGLAFWSTCDVGYFAGKCVASPNGTGYKDWDRRSADAYLDEIGAEDPRLRDRLQKFRARDSIASSLEWSMFLGVHGHDVFGGEYYEYARIGEVISDRCEAHLVGLKLAMAQLHASAALKHIEEGVNAS